MENRNTSGWMSHGALRSALLLSLAWVLPGCSFLFTTAPKRAESPTEFASNKCTTSKAAPIVDTLIAGYQSVRSVYAMTADKSAYEDAPISREVDIAAGVGLFTLFTASAIYGYYVTGQCSARRDRAVIVQHPEKPEVWDPDTRPPAAPRQQWNNQPRSPAPASDLAP
jgi:hypothetical protein